VNAAACIVCGGGMNLWDKLCRNDRQYISVPKSHLLAVVRNALKTTED